MAQTSIASYFATRKRPATDDNIIRAKKVLLLDPVENTLKKSVEVSEESQTCSVIYGKKETLINNNETINSPKIYECNENDLKFPQRSRLVTKLNFDSISTCTAKMTVKKISSARGKPRKLTKDVPNQPSIETFLNLQNKVNVQETNIQNLNEKTPPTSPTTNALDKIQLNNKDLSLIDIKSKLTRSARLAELKASISKFNKNADKLKEIEKKTSSFSQNSAPNKPTLKTFKSIELEVQVSPKKQVSPVKPYLSPKKDFASPRKNLFGLSSPTKNTNLLSPTKLPAYQRFQSLSSPGKPSLTLPFKYRSLAEMFRSIDTVCAMLFNRKETITFNKLKPAVQEMMRRNLTSQHFAQLRALYPDSFTYHWEKMKAFASRQEKYELVITPVIPATEQETTMNPTVLLDRRRKLFKALLAKVKDYHNEFLMSLDPPMIIPRDKITRWHPEFDIEKIPDIESAELPKEPAVETLTTGQDVLQKARSLFNCNTRMEKALERLNKQMQEKKQEPEQIKPIAIATPPSLKGIPTALLEKIRAKQAAKALDAMTRSTSQDKDALIYSRLPDLARLLRNTFVAEKKGVLPLEEIIIKLNNSYRSRLTNSEIEEHLRLLSKVVPGWIVFHEVRKTLFIKVARDGDMSKVMTKLESLAEEKCTN